MSELTLRPIMWQMFDNLLPLQVLSSDEAISRLTYYAILVKVNNWWHNVTSCNLVNIYQTTWGHIPQVSILHSRLCEILTLVVTSFIQLYIIFSWCQWPRGPLCRSAAARSLGLQFRISPGDFACMLSLVSVCVCVCCQVEVSASGWSLLQRPAFPCVLSEFAET